MNKLVFAGLALMLAGGGCLGLGTQTKVEGGAEIKQEETKKPEGAQGQEGDVAAVMLEGKNAINVEADQPVGGKIAVGFAVLEKPGYVVIHAEANGAPGKIIGKSALLAAGRNENVVVDVKVEDEVYYWAMLHADDGDGTFNASTDAPVKDSKGNVIMMRFEGSAEATLDLDTKTMLDANGVKVNVDADVAAKVSTYDVAIQNFAFSQKSLTVKKGDKIVFTQKDSVAHNVTADGGAFKGPLLQLNQSWTLDTSTLAPGTYPYHCGPHPGMTATLVVQ
jgi:plastocyanin